MKNVAGIISTNYRSAFLQGLSQDRPVAAVPFGGRYRLLDFALSNMVNSGLRTVGIITPSKYRPILDHLGAGKEWYLDRKNGGMFILPGANYGIYKREIKFYLGDLINNIEFIKRDYSDYVIISGCNNIINIDYTPVLDFHERNAADISLIYKNAVETPNNEDPGYILNTYPNGRIGGIFQEKPPESRDQVKLFADMLIINRPLFLEILQSYTSNEYMDLLEVITENLNTLKVFAYEHKGYLGRVHSIQSYFDCNMDVLRSEIRNELFMETNKIRTKIKDNPPTKYGEQGFARDSLVSSGCCIQGQVERSILFRGVRIEPGAIVKNSIIMQDSHIGKDSVLENVILDKYVQVNEKAVLKGRGDIPVVVSKYKVV